MEARSKISKRLTTNNFRIRCEVVVSLCTCKWEDGDDEDGSDGKPPYGVPELLITAVTAGDGRAKKVPRYLPYLSTYRYPRYLRHEVLSTQDTGTILFRLR